VYAGGCTLVQALIIACTLELSGCIVSRGSSPFSVGDHVPTSNVRMLFYLSRPRIVSKPSLLQNRYPDDELLDGPAWPPDWASVHEKAEVRFAQSTLIHSTMVTLLSVPTPAYATGGEPILGPSCPWVFLAHPTRGGGRYEACTCHRFAGTGLLAVQKVQVSPSE
jgi:hypothetical protein